MCSIARNFYTTTSTFGIRSPYKNLRLVCQLLNCILHFELGSLQSQEIFMDNTMTYFDYSNMEAFHRLPTICFWGMHIFSDNIYLPYSFKSVCSGTMWIGESSPWRPFAFCQLIKLNTRRIFLFCVEITSARQLIEFMDFMTNVRIFILISFLLQN